ncbi:MAG: hypothetical protein VZR13_06125, partial [Saccharofermentanaceae bacterium]|nr:hypothetical protein [Saccharofermentanaceae bacterium]
VFGKPLEKSLPFAVSALFFQNISTCGIVFGNLLEKAPAFAVSALFFQNISTCGIVLEICWKSSGRECFSRRHSPLTVHRKALLGEHFANKRLSKCFSGSHSPHRSPKSTFR